MAERAGRGEPWSDCISLGACACSQTKDRQGGDVGSQYRSAIFYHSEEQKRLATERTAAEEKKLGKHVVTEIAEAGTWYPGEDYHQKYLEKGGQCSAKGDKTPIRCYG